MQDILARLGKVDAEDDRTVVVEACPNLKISQTTVSGSP